MTYWFAFFGKSWKYREVGWICFYPKRNSYIVVEILGTLPQPTTLCQESSVISVPAPVLSVSTDRSESPVKTTEHSHEEVKRNSKKANHGRGAKQVILSPASVRRSPRFKVLTFWSHAMCLLSVLFMFSEISKEAFLLEEHTRNHILMRTHSKWISFKDFLASYSWFPPPDFECLEIRIQSMLRDEKKRASSSDFCKTIESKTCVD